jgi:hypothetical protein
VSIVVQFLPLLVYTYWMVRRASQSRPATTADQPAPRRAAAIGLEDDPDQWHAWTALDERQLIRLLTDSAPRHRPATNSADNAVPQVEHKDTP